MSQKEKMTAEEKLSKKAVGMWKSLRLYHIPTAPAAKGTVPPVRTTIEPRNERYRAVSRKASAYLVRGYLPCSFVVQPPIMLCKSTAIVFAACARVAFAAGAKLPLPLPEMMPACCMAVTAFEA